MIETPSNFALETPTRLTWNGPYEFDDSELEIVFVRTGDSLLSMPGWLIGGLLVIVGIGAGGYLLARRDDQTKLSIPTDRLPSLAGVKIGTRGTDGEGSATAESTGSDSTAGLRSDSGAVTAPSDSAARPGGTSLEFEEPGDDIDPELLSDEERVLRLLKQNGGRMKQASIVSETGWSNAKVSQLLSKMDDDDEIEKLRIGRENLITLPGVDPTELD
ncbi:helix-turn-helix transcriptional regulator [Natrinema sp. LN54]|uniref:helix-turn-helix transcriptional regulator n=1 Tax=Natrinema sp. LN54 TaxID=3458705 RepID=UPI004036DA20